MYRYIPELEEWDVSAESHPSVTGAFRGNNATRSVKDTLPTHTALYSKRRNVLSRADQQHRGPGRRVRQLIPGKPVNKGASVDLACDNTGQYNHPAASTTTAEDQRGSPGSQAKGRRSQKH